jgi:hypothetical protein
MEVSFQLHAPAALSLEEKPPVPLGYEAEWASEPVWTLWIREKIVSFFGNRTLIVQPVGNFLPSAKEKNCLFSN